jgi:hypothetical protein
LCFIVKPSTWTPGRTPDTFQSSQRSHIIAFPNADVRQLHGVLQPLASVPDDLQVVFINLTANEDVREATAKFALGMQGFARAWKRGSQVGALPERRKCLGGERMYASRMINQLLMQAYNVDVNPATLAEYEELDGVPPVLLENAVHATTEEEAQNLAAAFTGDRQGYANTHQHPSAAGKLAGPYISYGECFKSRLLVLSQTWRQQPRRPEWMALCKKVQVRRVRKVGN